MHSHIAMIGSTAIGGLLLLSMMGFQLNLKDHSYRSTFYLNTQQEVRDAIDILEGDLRMMGFGVDSTAITAADTNRIVYLTDLGHDETVDQISYHLISEDDGTPLPPAQRRLCRQANNGSPATIAAGVVEFKLKYFDNQGNETTILAAIKSVEVMLRTVSSVSENDYNTGYFWKQRITPAGLLY